jgi:hypothetical protein
LKSRQKMKKDYTARRVNERFIWPMPVQVKCRESEDFEWTESTQILDISQCGARLFLKHPSEPGRLIFLTFNMPRRFRLYDPTKLHYGIWAVVRHIQRIAGVQKDGCKYEVGLAFIGKHEPDAHKRDPTILFELKPIPSRDGLWIPRPKSRDPFMEDKKEHKGLNPLGLALETFDLQGDISLREETSAKSISNLSASVLTQQSLTRGRFVRLVNTETEHGIIAVVRDVRKESGQQTSVQCDFIIGE